MHTRQKIKDTQGDIVHVYSSNSKKSIEIV